MRSCPMVIKVSPSVTGGIRLIDIYCQSLISWMHINGFGSALRTIYTPLMQRSRIISFLTLKPSLHANSNLNVKVSADTNTTPHHTVLKRSANGHVNCVKV
ncbi:hypothetical protein QL285_021808 [Trifolium repens]|nr:hypothetical protein QL285_021808 [Trifolium repens]